MVAQRDASGIGALADPVRHRLYEFVCAQPDPVSREQAADAVGIPHHQAKFHLDRLTAEGLLETDYGRLTGRTGPGAGRTAKLYRRTRRDIAVSLPQREYELAGRLMAAAIARSTATGEPVAEVLDEVAHDYGQAIGATADKPADTAAALEVGLALLAEYGYEPRRNDGHVELANCPFHALAQEQTALACGMNHALIAGVCDALAPYGPDAVLEPGPARCCVVLKSRRSNAPASQ
ncbi:transcriptional regulator [Mycobacterium kubicae]|uniref:Helix-turn-helix domain-containing protein n=1 Tax=Mycobacterium kubicae TaxID=120959 RepID=A0AAX1JH64_9MYCO|nr:helix-turn-helix domain-containing protein [Mycobacterium kubicae]MCV7097174.1 helix-turn-helix domain-containing protein [Mycobacterium kubicae]OBK41764.1 transcriptional regulator [Mycobacterium kubicae]ORW03221.1 transcriptional regulator [Mycobacterium kubicae]QNI09379.1 helix-turn-helix domain-containing protein [Mycobacterium kubicae]QNI11573.1 helix-turn-helix domain-containing protein [Mycobacterium kubicae]